MVKPTLVASGEGADDFLATTDLLGTAAAHARADDDGPQLISLLNSRLLDEIAAAALRVEQLVDPPRAYVSETLHLYLTLTNLRGVPYEVTFKGGAYHMLSHGDRVHYAVTGLGGWPTASAFADNDRYRPLAAAALKNPPSDEWVRLTACALASAAFPVGLAPRLIQAHPDEYAGAQPPETLFRRFPDDNLADRGNINPSWGHLSELSFMTVDGGTIDNDPFEYARFALKKGGQSLAERIEWRLDKADRAVIMISPFPDGAQMRPDGAPAPDILSIVSTLAPALIEQARFKPSELVLAADPEHGSRFLVAPKRYEAGAAAPYPIASGLLGGFGGFVSEAFRAHDFQLGRRNCQKFLRGTFALPASNELFRNWPAAAFGADLQSTDEEAGETEKFYCLIPLFGAAANEVAEPDWPRIGKKDLDAMQNKIGRRFDAVAEAFLADKFRDSWPLRAGARILRRPIRKKALDFIAATVIADLVRRDQIEGFAALPDGAGLGGDKPRMILAALIAPGKTPRSAADIAASMGGAVAAPQIERALESLTGAEGEAYKVWKAPWPSDDGQSLYALADRKPPALQRLWSFLRAAIRSLRRGED